MRMETFIKRDNAYAAINANPNNTFKVGHNVFSDWTDEEIESMFMDEKESI